MSSCGRSGSHKLVISDMKHMTDSEAKEQTRKIEDAEALARDRASRASGGTMPTHVEQPRIVY